MTFKLSVFLLAASVMAQAQAPAAPPPGRGGGAPQAQAIQPIKPNLFLITGAGGNTTLQIANDGLIVVDGKLPGDANYAALMALIKGVSDKPIKYLLLTHHHQDHNQRGKSRHLRYIAQDGVQGGLFGNGNLKTAHIAGRAFKQFRQ